MNSKEIKSRITEGWILSRTIIEIVGKPKNHVEKTIKDYIKSMKDNKNIEILNEKISRAKKHEGSMYAAFAELGILFKNLNELVYFCFDYMPSSIEIEEPERTIYHARDLTNFMNDLQGRLHDVDMAIKQTRQQNIKLNEAFTALLKNFVLVSCVNEKTIEQLEKIIGLEGKLIKKVIDVLIKEKRLKKDGESFLTIK